ncbi:uncharacterized protein LOC118464375 [Anopheles albimanus]|uniref:uncharacterized protein LOC118464375 n=1 Tax=Anopheles albimanus TaxID=7167 RepID=UPI00164201DE|nr:uncharacterized protein LOC118464375 [Anopheles albimanus]
MDWFDKRRGVVAVALVVAILALSFLPSVRSQAGSNFPATEFTFGSSLPTQLICYTNSISSQSHRLFPLSRIFSFTPTAAQNQVRYIEVRPTTFQKFYAQIVSGGIGTANPTTTDILVTALKGGHLNVVVRIFCGA